MQFEFVSFHLAIELLKGDCRPLMNRRDTYVEHLNVEDFMLTLKKVSGCLKIDW